VTDAPLHPRRIEETLEWLRRERPENLLGDHYETLVSALKLLRKTQRTVGLTTDVADLGRHVLGVLDYVKRGLPR
jgi:hypothetical protein